MRDSHRFPARAQSREQSWDRILTCVGKGGIPAAPVGKTIEQSTRKAPTKSTSGVVAFYLPRLKLGKLFPVDKANKDDPDGNPAGW